MYIEQSSCVFCPDLKGVVEEINVLLAPEKRINIIDVTWDWGFNVILNPILNHVDIDATPTLYLDGRMYQGFAGREH